jgi:sigma-E factor negative regulatory protein RseA
MTQEISSLMDGELAPEEAQRAIKACTASAESKVDWHLYHVIGDAMRGQAPRSLAMPKDVIEALKSQPTVLAPQRRSPVTFTRVALAAAASVATIGVVGWIGSQGGQGSTAPVAAKSGSAIQPVSNTVPVRDVQPSLDVQTYLNAHRQLPTPEQYRPAQNRAPAAAAAR